jgi:N-acetyl-alpha-D-glucosaminyl L-malate synthase BshA
LVGKDACFGPVVQYSINQSDGVTTVSDSLKDETLAYFKIYKEIESIPNFIDLTRFKKEPRAHFKTAIAPKGEKIIIHTSNFRKVKRIDDVVKIFAAIRKEIPAKLLLVGDGPERIHIEKLCRELGLNDAVSFLGKQNQIEEILSVGDLFLMPSETESFGLAALEAMACELPVISSNAGGIPELNLEGVTGFLCNVGDVEGMAQKALYLLKNDVVLNEFKANALKRAERFNIDAIVPKYEAFYNKVLNQNK